MADCANCGRELRAEWKFCVRCGTAVAVAPGTGVIPTELPAVVRETEQPDEGRRVNPLAIVALALGILLSPVAALFGHLAVAQIRQSGERGVIAAWAGVALGWLWLVGLVVVMVGFLTANV